MNLRILLLTMSLTMLSAASAPAQGFEVVHYCSLWPRPAADDLALALRKVIESGPTDDMEKKVKQVLWNKANVGNTIAGVLLLAVHDNKLEVKDVHVIMENVEEAIIQECLPYGLRMVYFKQLYRWAVTIIQKHLLYAFYE